MLIVKPNSLQAGTGNIGESVDQILKAFFSVRDQGRVIGKQQFLEENSPAELLTSPSVLTGWTVCVASIVHVDPLLGVMESEV